MVKRDGARQPFDSQQADGRPGARVHQAAGVAGARSSGAAATDRGRLRNGIRDEVPSQAIGEQALAVLRGLDPVAYVRFASVYRDFQDVEEFEQELARMEDLRRTGCSVAIPNRLEYG